MVNTDFTINSVWMLSNETCIFWSSSITATPRIIGKHPAGIDRKVSVYHQEPTKASAGFAMSVFNLMNAILGSGILGLAYAMSNLGIILFLVLTVIVAILALYAINLLLDLCAQTDVKAYEKLGFASFGKPGRIVTACCILMQNIGAMSSYLFIVKYELPNVLMTLMGMHENDGSWYLNGDILVIFVTLTTIMPLASLKSIGFLGYTSGFSICCMLFFTGVIIAKKFTIPCPLFDQALFEHHDNITNATTEIITNAITEVYDGTTASPTGNEHMIEEAQELYDTFGPQQCEPNLATLSSRWAYSIPTMTFSFVCHTAVLPIYAELKQPSPAKMQAVSNTSVSICLVLYVLSAIFGYLTFFNWMEAEMLLMYSYVDSADVMTLVVRLTVLFAVILTDSLTHFPARKAITFLIFPDQPFTWAKHLGIMGFLLTFINVLVIFVPSIREVFGIIGATASTMLVFILPSVFYLKLDKRPIKTPRKISVICMATLGFGLMIQSLSVIIAGYFQ
jgi:amino acid permease